MVFSKGPVREQFLSGGVKFDKKVYYMMANCESMKEEIIEESSSDESVSGDEFEDQSDPEQLADIRDKSKSDSSSDSHNNY